MNAAHAISGAAQTMLQMEVKTRRILAEKASAVDITMTPSDIGTRWIVS